MSKRKTSAKPRLAGSPASRDSIQKKRLAGEPAKQPVKHDAAIDLRNVTVNRGSRKILDNISWSVTAGACAAILGPNGSGKSTLARVIMGQMWPTSGEVRILGRLFGETDLNELRESIRLVQAAGVVEFDPEETVAGIVLTGFFGTVGLYHDITPAMTRRANQLIRQVGLRAEATQAFRTLSSGERMRCLIARALVLEPRLLILDEPTAGLDVLAREQVLCTVQQLVRESKNPPAVLMITHHVEELMPETKHVLVLKAGKIAAVGLPREVLTTAVLSRVYEFPVKVTRRGGRFWLQVHSNAWEVLKRK
jgi:iron complex transport system ATP-binding protein